MTSAFDNDRQIAQMLTHVIERTTNHAVLLLNPSGEIVWCNVGAEHIFGSAAQSLVGRDIGVIFTADDRAAGIDRLEREIARNEAIAEDDRWHLRSDGTMFWSSGVLVPIFDPSDRALLGFGKIVRDRTDVKTQIELLSNQLTAAHSADQSKDHAITKLVHELRNVLGAMRASVELLDAPADNAARRAKFAGLMTQQLSIVERLAQDLLDVKRASTGKITLVKQPLVLQQELRSAIAGMEKRLREKELTLQLLAPPTDIVVEGDRVRIQQIFGNLLDNAIKYTSARGRIWVKVTTEADAAVVHIEDSGRGIPTDRLRDIFDLFTQVDTETSVGGLGVGLALVRELTVLHGGSVQATSKGLGLGSEFSVRLPLVSAT